MSVDFDDIGNDCSKASADDSEPEAPRRVTSYDVARRAGVSQSGVSRVFKPGASASASMRNRVLAAADELGYRPNAIARTLTTGRSNMVAVIISDLTNLYYPEVLSELTARFSRHGQRVLLFTLPQEAFVDRIIDDVVDYQVDGVISAARLSAPQVARFLDRGCPVVLYNRSFDDVPVSSVCCDHVAAARSLATLLIETGHRRIGFVSGPPDSVVSQERTRGFLDGLEASGYPSPLMITGDYSYHGGHTALQSLFRLASGNLDAVVCANDMMAIGALDAARHILQKQVPAQISIAGFDGIDPCQWDSYRLTTIRQPVRRMTGQAVELLLDRIAVPSREPVRRLVPAELVAGSTVRGLAEIEGCGTGEFRETLAREPDPVPTTSSSPAVS